VYTASEEYSVDVEFETKLRELSLRWDQAEEAIKAAENICLEVVDPAVKELRYAGRRLQQALVKQLSDSEEDKKYSLALLQDAIFDCLRSRHDASDAAISKLSIDLDNATKQFSREEIVKQFPNVAAYAIKITALQIQIASTRKDVSKRDDVYAAIENVELGELKLEAEKLLEAEKILQARDRIKKGYLPSLRKIIGFDINVNWIIWVGIIGSIASILSFFGITYATITK
jgi:hypothetical protein